MTLARVLTGWGVNEPNARFFPEHAAVFEGARHDYSPKVFLGHPLKSRGKAEGEEALDILARSPATARVGSTLADSNQAKSSSIPRKLSTGTLPRQATVFAKSTLRSRRGTTIWPDRRRAPSRSGVSGRPRSHSA